MAKSVFQLDKPVGIGRLVVLESGAAEASREFMDDEAPALSGGVRGVRRVAHGDGF